MLKYAFAAAILIGFGGSAYAAGSCPAPFQIDVLGDCKCPNIKEKLAFKKAGYDVDAVCPIASNAAHEPGSDRGNRWEWFRSDGRHVTWDYGDPIPAIPGDATQLTDN